MASAQTIADNTVTKVIFDTEITDNNNNYDNATNYRFTPTVSGQYLALITLRYATSVDQGSMAVLFYKNGSQVGSSIQRGSGTGNISVSFAGLVSMNGSTDFLEAYAYHTTGTDRNLSNGNGVSTAVYVRVGA
jgi:hypothetical protein